MTNGSNKRNHFFHLRPSSVMLGPMEFLACFFSRRSHFRGIGYFLEVGAQNSTYRSYNPSYPSLRLFIGVIIPFITSRGALSSKP